MAIFAPNNTSGYSDPLKALSIKALEQRQKDLLAQEAAQANAITPENTQTPIQGFGHLANILGDQFRQGRADQALAANRDTLAKAMTGLDMDNPDPAKMATIAALAPDIHTHLLQTWAENRRADRSNATTARGQDVTARGQDVTANTAVRGQDVVARGQDVAANTAAANTAATVRGQDVSANTATRGQDITARGQDMTQNTAVRGQDVVANTATRGQDVTARGQDMTQNTAVRGQDTVANTATRGQDVTARGQDVIADTTQRGQNMTQDTAVRGQDTVAATAQRGQDVTARGQDMTQSSATRGQDVTARGQDITQATTMRGQDMANRVKMDDLTKGTGIMSEYAQHAQALDRLQEAQQLVHDGINTGFWSNAQTKAAQIADGRWGTDADAAARTTRFNQIMDQHSIAQMAAQLKGQTTNFEMGEFQKINNNPNSTPEQRIAAIQKLIAQATVDKDVYASAARTAQKQIGGPTVEDIDATLATGRKGGGANAPKPALSPEDTAAAIQDAKAAIASGTSRAAVIKRLEENNVPTKGL